MKQLNFVVCPVCAEELPSTVADPNGAIVEINCLNCQPYQLTASALAVLRGGGLAEPRLSAQLSHGIRRMPPHALINTDKLNQLAKRTQLPSAIERVENVILHVAGVAEPGLPIDLLASHLRAVVGAETAKSALWAMRQARAMGYLEGEDSQSHTGGHRLKGVVLTTKGWERYTELLRSGARSAHAFMAMKFGDSEIQRVYRDHMRPAIALTGFELRTTNEDHKTAGSIDNRMRVEIRTSRFVVCDLTHGNRGAYWEAGFAEGLGRPVFYTCRRDVLADRGHPDHPHFDTAHQLIVAWDPGEPSVGMQELKDVVRATLPAEAKMEDNSSTRISDVEP